MASLFDTQNAFNPGDDLVGRWVSGFVEIDDAVPDVVDERALERGVTVGKRRVVSGSYIEAVVVLQENRPLRGVDRGSEALGLDDEVFGGGVVVVGVSGVRGEGRGVIFCVG